MGSLEPTSSVAAFCVASEACDVDGMVATLAPDAELVSPISGRMVFRGRDDLRPLGRHPAPHSSTGSRKTPGTLVTAAFVDHSREQGCSPQRAVVGGNGCCPTSPSASRLHQRRLATTA